MGTVSRPAIRRRLLALLVPAAVPLALAACHDEESPDLIPLRDLWPDADGTVWTYEYEERRWEPATGPLYPSPAQVPPPPTIAEVAALLDSHAEGTVTSTNVATYRLGFDGLITTQSGAVGRRVTTEVLPVAPAARDVFLARLWMARPDLRERLRQEVPSIEEAVRRAVDFKPLFLSGYAWAITDDWIGGYGDLDLELSWKYLEAHPVPGREFSMQLLPSLTDDVFLHARILPRQNLVTPAGVFRDAVVCLYLVDYGIGEVTDDRGILIGYLQHLSYGTVAYVAGVGPVHSYERPLLSTGDPLPVGSGELTITLSDRFVPVP